VVPLAPGGSNACWYEMTAATTVTATTASAVVIRMSPRSGGRRDVAVCVLINALLMASVNFS
jgi:hypothetical protein